MTLTLLLDLDDTLLQNSMDTFIPAYLKSLSSAMQDFSPPEQLVSVLLAATQSMFQNNDFRLTLKEAFDRDFYPALGIDPLAAAPELADFYANAFSDLATLTQPMPGARELVEEALRRGYRIAIATNPLFPRAAIEQRLAWAGLPVTKYPFALVSSYEEFHYTKPRPEYFAEVLARLGWPEGPILLVGDDPENDIAPAAALGLASYHVAANEPSPLATGSGDLRDLLSWLDAQPPEALTPALDSVPAILATFRSSPAVLAQLFAGVPAPKPSQRPQPTEWSIGEILCHLRDVDAEVTRPRIAAILATPEAFIEAVDPDQWAESRAYQEQDPHTAFIAWQSERQALVQSLAALTPEDWSRTARHTIFGPTSLLELMHITARHDRLHLRQVAATIAQVLA